MKRHRYEEAKRKALGVARQWETGDLVVPHDEIEYTLRRLLIP